MTAAFATDFHTAGFGIIKHAVTTQAAAGLKTRLVDLLPAGGTPLQRVVPRIIEHAPDFGSFALSGPLIGLLSTIFGVTPHLVCTYGHEKSAGTAAHTGPHSDVAHLPGVPHHQSMLMVKAMLALTPVAEGSGCTVIIPGSHRDPAADTSGVQVLLEPGDLFLFHANIRHTATANTSAVPRLSLWFAYALPWMRVFPSYEFSPAFIDGLRPRFAAEPHLPALLGLADPYATA